MSVAATVPVARCAVHPSRRAADRCPVCDRPRCGADVASYGDRGCAACVVAAARRTPTAPPLERLVRAALAALVVAFAGAWIAAQYVDTQWFGVIAPGLVGLGCGWAASAAAGRPRARIVTVVAVTAALLATGLSDRLVPGGQNLLVPASHRLPPYLAAVVGVLAWPVLFGPPRSSRGRRG